MQHQSRLGTEIRRISGRAMVAIKMGRQNGESDGMIFTFYLVYQKSWTRLYNRYINLINVLALKNQ